MTDYYKLCSTVDGGVRCFSCGVGLEEYTENDLPWELHAKYSPKCRHILSEGSEYFQTAYLDIGTNKVQVYIFSSPQKWTLMFLTVNTFC